MIISDEELGEIRFVKNARSKRVVARMKDDYMQVSYPSSMSFNSVRDIVAEMRPRLSKLKERKPSAQLFALGSNFSTFSFEVNILETTLTNFYFSFKNGVLAISCPKDTDFQMPEVQTLIRGAIENTMRYESKRLFPSKVAFYAKQCGFKVADVKINKSRTRWGSCSSKKTINLSYFCTLLPEYLIDFIILHELCHTIEMNHGPRFWALLDKVTDNNAKKLTQELKQYKTNW